jgi:chromosome segregation ATPase
MEGVTFMDWVQITAAISGLAGFATIIGVIVKISRDNKSIEKAHTDQEKAHDAHSREHREIESTVRMETKDIQQRIGEVRDKQEETKGTLIEVNHHVKTVGQFLSEERRTQEMYRRDATKEQNSIKNQVDAIQQMWQEMAKLQSENSQLREEKQQLHEKILNLQANLKQYEQKYQRPRGYDGPSMER